jgi:hypothetical protein
MALLGDDGRPGLGGKVDLHKPRHLKTIRDEPHQGIGPEQELLTTGVCVSAPAVRFGAELAYGRPTSALVLDQAYVEFGDGQAMSHEVGRWRPRASLAIAKAVVTLDEPQAGW